MEDNDQAVVDQDATSAEEHRDRDAALEAARDDETVSDQQSCPQCGEPVHNLRKTCPNCGYEYKDSEYDDHEAGQDFVAGKGLEQEQQESAPDQDAPRPDGQNEPTPEQDQA